MSDRAKLLIQVQQDALHKLLSEAQLNTVNCVLLRKLVVESEVSAQNVVLTARNGKSGAGIVVGMPFIRAKGRNLPALAGEITLPVHIYESPILNLDAANGTLITAEELALLVEELFRHHEGCVRFYTDDEAVLPDPDNDEALISYTVEVRAKIAQAVAPRCLPPSAAAASLTVTLANHSGNPSADIYYTTDGSFPGVGNAAATPYTAPFTVTAGTTVKAAAWESGKQGSNVTQLTVS
jgi:hypothetical protein